MLKNSELVCNEKSSAILGLSDDVRPAYLYKFCFEHPSLGVRVKEEPEEYVTIEDLHFGKKKKYKPLELKNVYVQTCSLKLRFKNHEISPHLYTYKVVCKALVKKFHVMHHVLLFEKTNVREYVMISHDFCLNSKYLEDEELIHICFEIKRFKNKNINNKPDEDIFYQKLLDSGEYFDVAFRLENTIFRAHKHILTLKCKKMNLPKMDDGEMATIYNKVFKANVIEAMLSYIYTGQIKNIRKVAMAMLKVIHRYGIEDLKIICEEALIFNLDEENAESILEAAKTYGLKTLQTSAKHFLKWRR